MELGWGLNHLFLYLPAAPLSASRLFAALVMGKKGTGRHARDGLGGVGVENAFFHLFCRFCSLRG